MIGQVISDTNLVGLAGSVIIVVAVVVVVLGCLWLFIRKWV